MTGICVERGQAQLVVVSNERSGGLGETDHVAVVEPLVAEMHSHANAVLCDQVTRDVQRVQFSHYCSPAIANEVEARLEELGLVSG